ncbi:MAG: T9SS type A sorting domain-containing protein [Aureispira sp.]|nr:T9SS type A sorting domain-containing protein [Aureispira sp.]
MGQPLVQKMIDSQEYIKARDWPAGVYVLSIRNKSGIFLEQRKLIKN